MEAFQQFHVWLSSNEDIIIGKPVYLQTILKMSTYIHRFL